MALVDRLYIYAIDQTFSFADWIDGLITVGEIYHHSVADMVNKILAKIGTRQIQNLFIGGHGTPGYQAVGCGSVIDTTGYKSLRVDRDGKLVGTAEREIRRLLGRFAPGAIITLGGCNVGQDIRLLQAIVAALEGQVVVQAATDSQWVLLPGMEGHVIRCGAVACVDMGGWSWWSSPGSWVQ